MDDLNDWEKIKRQTAEMMLRAPMIHGATGPTEYWLEVIDKMYADYGVNVSIFMRCRAQESVSFLRARVRPT